MPAAACAMKNCFIPCPPFHYFRPKNPNVTSWLEIANNPELYTLSKEKLANRAICSKHFKEEDKVMRGLVIQVKKTAIPTLFLDGSDGSTLKEAYEMYALDVALSINRLSNKAQTNLKPDEVRPTKPWHNKPIEAENGETMNALSVLPSTSVSSENVFCMEETQEEESAFPFLPTNQQTLPPNDILFQNGNASGLKRCSVCDAQRGPDINFHYLPSNIERASKWLEILGVQISEEDILKIKDDFVVCSKHFNVSDFDTRGYLNGKITMPLPYDATVGPSDDISEIDVDLAIPALSINPFYDSMFDAKLTNAVSDIDHPHSNFDTTVSTTISSNIPVYESSNSMSNQNLLPSSTSHSLTKFNYVKKLKQPQLTALKELCNNENKLIQRLKNVEIFEILDDIFRGMSPKSALLFASQVQSDICTVRDEGWTLEVKIACLSIFERTPHYYILLCKYLPIPNESILIQLLAGIPFCTGINKHTLKEIANNISRFNKFKYCTLLFGEMRIKKNLHYNAEMEYIEGFQDLGLLGRTGNVANRALVFMIRGLVQNIKQPVACYFSHKSVPSDVLASLILHVISSLQKAGVKILATVCDISITNVKTLSKLGSTKTKPYFIVDDSKIWTLFDAPSLLKSTRNNLFKHPLHCTVSINNIKQPMIAQWNHIVAVYDADKKDNEWRTLHKLSSMHMNLTLKAAKKVKVAAKTLSTSVSIAIFKALKSSTIEPNALATAIFVREVDQIFDSFNGPEVLGDIEEHKTLRSKLSKNSPHMSYWQSVETIIDDWQFYKSLENRKVIRPFAQDGWLTNIRAIRGLWTEQGQHLQEIVMRRLNMDPLENLFATLRVGCGANKNPTCKQFMRALKTYIITDSPNDTLQESNCLPDNAELLTNLTSYIMVLKCSGTEFTKSPFGATGTGKALLDTITREISFGKTSISSVVHISAIIAKNILDNRLCVNCQSLLVSKCSNVCDLFVSFSETNDANCVIYPTTESVIVTVGQIISLLERVVLPVAHKLKNLKVLTDLIIKRNIDFSWITCSEHIHGLRNDIILYTVQAFLPFYCSETSKIYSKAARTKRK